jgi:hypothetical protein
MFYDVDGKCLFLSWQFGERAKGLDFKKNAWCIDMSDIRAAKLKECVAIGVAHKIGKSVFYYLTNIEDIEGVQSFAGYSRDHSYQRCLPRDAFPVNTTRSAGNIEKAIRIR